MKDTVCILGFQSVHFLIKVLKGTEMDYLLFIMAYNYSWRL